MNCPITCRVAQGVSTRHSIRCPNYEPEFREITGNDSLDYMLNATARNIQWREEDDSYYDPFSPEYDDDQG